jgi:hypothetical protein
MNLNEIWTHKSADTIADALIKEAREDFRRDVQKAKGAYCDMKDITVKWNGIPWVLSVEFDHTPSERGSYVSPGYPADVSLKAVKSNGQDILDALPEDIQYDIRWMIENGK